MVDTSDDGAGGEIHPMGYMDDIGAATPHVKDIFFFEEFNRLGQPLGLHLNPSKTRILISKSGTSSLTSIEREYGSVVAGDLCKTIWLHLSDATPLSTIADDLPTIEGNYDASVVSAIHWKIA